MSPLLQPTGTSPTLGSTTPPSTTGPPTTGGVPPGTVTLAVTATPAQPFVGGAVTIAGTASSASGTPTGSHSPHLTHLAVRFL